MSKCEVYSSFVYSNFWQQETRLLDVLCPCHGGFQPPHYTSVLLQGLLSKIKLTTNTNRFLHLLSARKSLYMSDGLKLFILFKICIAIDSWVSQARPFRTFNPIESPLTSTTLCKPFIFFVPDSYWTSHDLSFFSNSLSFRPFIIHPNNYALVCTQTLQIQLTSLALPCPFFCASP